MKSCISLLLFFTFFASSLFAQKIGVNTTTPQHPVHIKQPTGSTLTDQQPLLFTEYTGTNSAHAIAIKGKSKPADNFGTGGEFEGGFIGVQGKVSGIGEGNYYGVLGTSSGTGSGYNFGLFGGASGPGFNVGVLGQASGGITNWAGFFADGNVHIKNKLGVGTLSPASPLHVTQGVTSITSTGAVATIEFVGTSSTADIYGLKAKCTPAAGWGVGGSFEGGNIGLRGSVSAASPFSSFGIIGSCNGGTTANYGIQGTAGNSANLNVGVYGYADDIQNNFSGYFSGARVYIQNKLGIGTTNPSGNLEIEDNWASMRITTTSNVFGSYFILRNNTPNPTTLGGIQFETSTGSVPGAIFFTADNKLHLSVGSETRLLINNTGLIGIGRTPSTNRLEVEGNASKSSAGDWLANSDARLKKNIQQLNSKEIAEKLLALHGITYEWNDNKTSTARPGGIQYGFTAQNIQEVFPELVEEDANGYLQTSYSTYDAMIIETLRYLTERINQLEARLAE